MHSWRLPRRNGPLQLIAPPKAWKHQRSQSSMQGIAVDIVLQHILEMPWKRPYSNTPQLEIVSTAVLILLWYRRYPLQFPRCGFWSSCPHIADPLAKPPTFSQGL